MGTHTLPVYEIYKAGYDIHWVEGINILESLGLKCAVIPHWNNAEGGTFDTRYCYMGWERFSKLEAMLPNDISVVGIDEHTACVIDFRNKSASVKGLGKVTLRKEGAELTFNTGKRFSLDLISNINLAAKRSHIVPNTSQDRAGNFTQEEVYQYRINKVVTDCREGIDKCDPYQTVNALLALYEIIWKIAYKGEHKNLINQARELFRVLVTAWCKKIQAMRPKDRDVIAPIVEDVLILIDNLKRTRKEKEANAVLEALKSVGIVVEYTEDGRRWDLKA
jgi:hypothetical protein